MSKAGEKPGKGTYTCVVCGWETTLEDENAVLPVCPVCGAEDYTP